MEELNHDQRCYCGCDVHFKCQCEKDPGLKEKTEAVNKVIKKRALEIREERERNNS